MHAIHALIIDLTLITIYAGITTLIFKKLKQPTVLGYILAGIFAGPFFNFVPTVSDKENLTLWADIGVIFLMNMQLGFLTPPVGMDLFIASYTFERPVIKIVKGIFPFLVVQFFILMCVTYIPWFTEIL